MIPEQRGPSYLMLGALRDVIEGRRKYAYGIGRCSHCTEPWIKDGEFKYCADCRHTYVVYRKCDECRVQYRLEYVGHQKCGACREQLSLFP
jgi:hypothetical protein